MRRTLKLRTALLGLGAALMLALAAPNIASAANMQALTNAPPTYQAYLPGIVTSNQTDASAVLVRTVYRTTDDNMVGKYGESTLTAVDNDTGMTSSTYATSGSPPPTSHMKTLVAMPRAENDTDNPPTGYHFLS